MHIAYVTHNGQPTAILSTDGGQIWTKPQIPAGSPQDLSGIYQAGDLSAMAQSAQPIDSGALNWLPPIVPATKILAIGLNYKDHAKEQKSALPTQPLIFIKLTSSVIPHGHPINWDPAITQAVDYEAELAVIIGKKARYVTEAEALDYVFGYTCANDVTARDLQAGDGQWARVKGMDTFCPLGPWIVTRDAVRDPQAIGIHSMVNGEVRQNSNTSEMVFSVRQIIAYLSRAFTLQPGDVILTGTPAGVGNGRDPKVFLAEGDEVVVELDGIGRLENRCHLLPHQG